MYFRELLSEINLGEDNTRQFKSGVKNTDFLASEIADFANTEGGTICNSVRYPGNDIHASEYLDTENYTFPLPELFEGAMSFVLRNLHKVQADQGINAPGTPEIPSVALEELLV